MTQDLLNNVKASRGISPVSGAADNTTQVSQIIDTASFDSLVFLLALGTLSDADATFAVTMDHGDAANLSDAAAVASTDLVGTLAGASFIFSDDDTVKKVGYIGSKRYVRLTITPSNNTGAWLLAVIALQGSATKSPVS